MQPPVLAASSLCRAAATVVIGINDAQTDFNRTGFIELPGHAGKVLQQDSVLKMIRGTPA